MRSLPSGWKEAAVLSRVAAPVVRLYYGAEGANDYLALTTHKGVELDGIGYVALLAKPPNIRRGVNRKTFEPEVGRTEIRVLNREWAPGKLFSDFLEDLTKGSGVDVGFEGRKVEIRKWTKGVTTWAGCAPGGTYSNRDPYPDGDEMVFICQDGSTEKEDAINLPRTVVTATAYPYAPQSSIGKRIPITVGAIDRAPGVWTNDLSVSGSGEILLDDPTYAVNGLKAYNVQSGSETPDKGPLYVKTKATAPDNVVGETISLRTTTRDYTYNATDLANCRISMSTNTFRVGIILRAVEESGNPYDENLATYDEVELDQNSNENRALTVAKPGGEFAGGRGKRYARCKIYASMAVADDSNLEFKLQDSNKEIVIIDISSGNETFNNIASGVDSLVGKNLTGVNDEIVDEITDYIYNAVNTKINVNPDAKATVRWYELELYIEVRFDSEQDFEDWYVDVQGRKDDGSGTYTGTPNALIENPADIIRFIAEKDLGMTTDATAFAAARNARSGWKFAFNQSDKISWGSLRNLIARDAGLYLGKNDDGQLTCVPIKTTYSDGDVAMELDWDDFIEGTPKFGRTGIDEVMSRVELRYKKNYVTEQYDGLATATHPDTETRYSVATEHATLFRESDYIRDSATADPVAALMLKRDRNPHNTLNACAPLPECQALEFGDIIKLKNVPRDQWPRGKDVTALFTVNGQTIYPYFLILVAEDRGGELYIESEQPHDLS